MSKEKEINKCEEEVWNNWDKYQCSRKGKHKVNGKWYCWQHKPKQKDSP